MRFATRNNGTPDGQLLLISQDGCRAVTADKVAPSLLDFLRHWGEKLSAMQALATALNSGRVADSFELDPVTCVAPLPCSPQWVDASAFLNHQRLMAKAFNTPLIPLYDTIPVLYQGASDDFLGPCVDVNLPDESHGIDFEGEFGVVVDAVPMGTKPDEALKYVRLLVQLNDWSLRMLGSHEVKTGFGFIQAKPSTSFAPYAITPDELGENWRNGRVHLNLHVEWNGNWFGHAHGSAMHYHFGELIAYAARTRKLSAGTIVGSGTVSNEERSAGSSCIAERRVIEIIDQGTARTNYMRFGDRVRMEARATSGEPGPFGAIDQRVVQS